jgi:ABC-type dipeptide/oligopeptide/nickel transport system permease subunit
VAVGSQAKAPSIAALTSSVIIVRMNSQPPAREWGSMIRQARNVIRQAWWMPTIPTLAIILLGVAFGVLRDGLAERQQTGPLSCIGLRPGLGE